MVNTAIHFWIIKETRLMLSQLKELNILKYADGGKIRDGGLFISTTVMVCGIVGQLETSHTNSTINQLHSRTFTLGQRQ